MQCIGKIAFSVNTFTLACPTYLCCIESEVENDDNELSWRVGKKRDISSNNKIEEKTYKQNYNILNCRQGSHFIERSKNALLKYTQKLTK